MKTDVKVNAHTPRPRIGQIRRVWIESYGSTFVCIARVFPAANLAEVIVVQSEPDRALQRDYIVEPDGEKLLFSVVISPDLVFSFNLSVIEESKVYGQICQQCVTDLFRQSFLNILPQNYEINENHDCLYPGNYEMRILDRAFMERSRLIEAVSSLSLEFLDYSEFVEERVQKYALFSNTEGERFSYRRLLNKIENEGQEDSIEILLERVASNHYARALVRC